MHRQGRFIDMQAFEHQLSQMAEYVLKTSKITRFQ